MNKPILSDIYRNGMQSTSDATADVDQLIAQIPRSPLQRDLIRFARDLEPESAQLSASLESVLNSDVVVHRNRFAAQRSARGRRTWRIASALAASLIAAVVVWSGSNLNRSHPSEPTASVGGDRIFSSFNENSVATQSGSDKIFTGDFRTDEIFSSSRHNNG
jgi:hypothetical protein